MGANFATEVVLFEKWGENEVMIGYNLITPLIWIKGNNDEYDFINQRSTFNAKRPKIPNILFDINNIISTI